MKHIKLVSFFLLCAVMLSFGNSRKMYVDQFDKILGFEERENELLKFVHLNKIDELILYDLHRIYSQHQMFNVGERNILARFIVKARTEYGIQKVSASGESGQFFRHVIHPYNLSRKSPSERIDVYNLEYEYWNERQSANQGYYCETYLKSSNLNCNREDSFNFFISSLEEMKALCNSVPFEIKLEAYVGTFTKAEAEQISKHIDMLLIHDYVKNPKYSYLYVKDRLSHLDAIHSHIEISILFSEENHFMGNWLRNHKFEEAEREFFAELERQDISLERHLNFTGFTYFNYSNFKRNEKKF